VSISVFFYANNSAVPVSKELSSPEIRIGRIGRTAVIATSDRSLTVTIPIRIKRRGLRKTVTLPDGGSLDSRLWDTAPTPLQLALARGHRWLGHARAR